MPTQEQYEQSDVGKAEGERIRNMVKDSPFWQKVIEQSGQNNPFTSWRKDAQDADK